MDDPAIHNAYEGFTSGTYVNKFGIKALTQIVSTLWVGGSVKLATHTGSDYLPVIVKMDKNNMGADGGYIITPNNV